MVEKASGYAQPVYVIDSAGNVIDTATGASVLPAGTGRFSISTNRAVNFIAATGSTAISMTEY